MTEVCLLGADDVDLPVDLFAYETARGALSAYDVREPYRNALAVETISLGQAVSLLNDLNWYLVRLVDEALVREPSVSETEWLSRNLARQIRDGDVRPPESASHLKIYGVETPEEGPPRLVEPMYASRMGEAVPDYDLRDVDDTLVVRVTADEQRRGSGRR